MARRWNIKKEYIFMITQSSTHIRGKYEAILCAFFFSFYSPGMTCNACECQNVMIMFGRPRFFIIIL